MESLKELACYLRDPQHVENFQRRCGIVRLNYKSAASNGSSSFGSRSKTTGTNLENIGSVGEHIDGGLHSTPVTWYNDDNNNSNINGCLRKGAEIVERKRVHGIGNGDTRNGHVNPTHCTPGIKGGDLHEESHEKRAFMISNKTLYYLFKCSAFLGDELFYILFWTFCSWNMDALVTRRASIVWGLAMYVGQAGKDYFGWKRPTYPVISLEDTYQNEFSMPSTHAMAATAIPMTIAYVTLTRYEIPALVVISLAVTWTVMVCLSRLYLGVHTILDVVAGIAVALAITLFMIPYIELFDWYQQTYKFSPVVTIATSLSLSTYIYPQCKGGYGAKADAVQIVAAACGMCIGCWINYYAGLSSLPVAAPPYGIAPITMHWVITSVMRFVTGCVLLFLSKLIVQKISLAIGAFVAGLDVPDKNNHTVMIIYKYITYLVLGCGIVSGVPYFHHVIGISRQSYYMEIK